MAMKMEASRARIREVRKDQGMTLQELADKVGTTAQSVQRLETGKTRLSLDWLDRFAAALEVPMSKLIGAEKSGTITLLGTMDSSGAVTHGGDLGRRIEIAVPARDPVAVRMSGTVGPFRQGSIVVGDKYRSGEEARADGRGCLVGLPDGAVLLRRVVVHPNRSVTLVEYAGQGEVMHAVSYRWLAPIVMVVNYF
jgi:transcriptional regulator with XRE-family HTH domain